MNLPKSKADFLVFPYEIEFCSYARVPKCSMKAQKKEAVFMV